MNTEHFRTALVAKIKSGDISQSQLSRVSGVPSPTICMFINGKRRDITLGYALRLWKHIYGCEPLVTINGN